MVRQGNIESAANLVHDIKGVAANISATDIYNNAAIIEADMKLKSTENLEMLLSKLECELEATLDSILRYLKER
jgi:HPt (histidine-containing phosphotransfer) domain-containing protein